MLQQDKPLTSENLDDLASCLFNFRIAKDLSKIDSNMFKKAWQFDDLRLQSIKAQIFSESFNYRDTQVVEILWKNSSIQLKKNHIDEIIKNSKLIRFLDKEQDAKVNTLMEFAVEVGKKEELVAPLFKSNIFPNSLYDQDYFKATKIWEFANASQKKDLQQAVFRFKTDFAWFKDNRISRIALALFPSRKLMECATTLAGNLYKWEPKFLLEYRKEIEQHRSWIVDKGLPITMLVNINFTRNHKNFDIFFQDYIEKSISSKPLTLPFPLVAYIFEFLTGFNGTHILHALFLTQKNRVSHNSSPAVLCSSSSSSSSLSGSSSSSSTSLSSSWISSSHNTCCMVGSTTSGADISPITSSQISDPISHTAGLKNEPEAANNHKRKER